jgi:tripartite-type tricarboxylate transporter receptor subunit TctC
MKNRRKTLVHAALIAACSLTLTQATSAQPAVWPTQAVKIVVPYAAGGTTDIAARILATELSKKWNQPVLVDNKPGAATQIGTDLVAKSKDSHTLLLTAAPFAVNPALFAKLPYDTYADFKPITLVVRSGLFLITGASQSYNNLADVIAAGQSTKGITMASAGNGSMGHMSAELLADMQKLSMTHVPYRGTPPAMNDVIAGQVQLMFDNPSTVLPQAKDGRVRVLAYTDRKRSKAMPLVPTVAEQGVAQFEVVNWFGMLAPSQLSDSVVDRISKDVSDTLRKRDIIERFSKEGVEVGGISREAFGAFLALETVRWAKIIKARNIKPD